MNVKENRHARQPEDTALTTAKTKQERAALPEPESAEEKLSASQRLESSEAGEAAGAEPAAPLKAKSFFCEQPPELIKVDPYILRRRTRREVLLFGAGGLAALAGAGSLLPQAMLQRLGLGHTSKPGPQKWWFFGRG